jgi:hypothetical protein
MLRTDARSGVGVSLDIVGESVEDERIVRIRVVYVMCCGI